MTNPLFNLLKFEVKDTVAEARNDGTIAVNPDVKPNSKLMKRVIEHEMKHIQDMEEGRAAYGDEWLMWEDKIYLRKNGLTKRGYWLDIP